MSNRRNGSNEFCSLFFSKYIFVFLLFFLLGFQSAVLLHGLIHIDSSETNHEISNKSFNRAKNLIFNQTYHSTSILNEVDLKSIKDLLHHLNNSNKITSQNISVKLPSCQFKKQMPEPGDLVWKPLHSRYLVALCSRGQLSNRLICIRQSMLDATLLNRTLILPTKGLDYNLEELLDLNAIRQCFGPHVFMTLEEYKRMIKRQVTVNLLICHVHKYQTEGICNQLTEKYSNALNITYDSIHIPKRRTTSGWFKYPNHEFIKRFNKKHSVLAFANMMGVGGRGMRIYDRKPFSVSNKCNGYLNPSKAIQDTATGFIDTLLGTRFMAVHIRRGDFFRHCLKGTVKAKTLRCYIPMTQVGKCIVDRLHAHTNVDALFVATNADDAEFDVLKSIISKKVESMPIVRLTSLKGKIWAEPLRRKGLDDNSIVLSLVEKTICAKSFVFFSNPGSTFSGDIHRLRSWWKGENTSCDAFLCPKEEDADIYPLKK